MSRPEQYCYYWYHYHYYPRLRMLTTRSRVRATLHSFPRSTLPPPYSCISSRSSLYYISLLYGHLVDGHPSHTIQYNSPAVLLHIEYTALLYLSSGQWSSITTLSTTIDYFSHLLIFFCLLTHQSPWLSLKGMSWSLCAKPCSSRT